MFFTQKFDFVTLYFNFCYLISGLETGNVHTCITVIMQLVYPCIFYRYNRMTTIVMIISLTIYMLVIIKICELLEITKNTIAAL